MFVDETCTFCLTRKHCHSHNLSLIVCHYLHNQHRTNMCQYSPRKPRHGIDSREQPSASAMLCSVLGYDILALTETHGTVRLRPSKAFVTGDIAPKDDPYAFVAILMSQRITISVLYSGCGARIVFVRVKTSPCNLFVVSAYVPDSGRQAPSASDTLAELEALLSKVNRHDCVVLLGDFNAMRS